VETDVSVVEEHQQVEQSGQHRDEAPRHDSTALRTAASIYWCDCSSLIAFRPLARRILVERFRNCRMEARLFLRRPPPTNVSGINPVCGQNSILEVLDEKGTTYLDASNLCILLGDRR
jgi:hypothetical protein